MPFSGLVEKPELLWPILPTDGSWQYFSSSVCSSPSSRTRYTSSQWERRRMCINTSSTSLTTGGKKDTRNIFIRNEGLNFRLVAVLAFTVEASLVTLRWRKEKRGGSLRDQPGLRYKISWVLSNINSSFSGRIDRTGSSYIY